MLRLKSDGFQNEEIEGALRKVDAFCHGSYLSLLQKHSSSCCRSATEKRWLLWLIIYCCPILTLAEANNYSTGLALQRADSQCPIIVASIFPHSPAARAGIRAGDEITSVNGRDARLLSVVQASTSIKSSPSGAVLLTLRHKSGEQYIRHIRLVPREEILRLNGWKDVSGVVVPIDTSDVEVGNMLHFDGRRIAERIFPTHYPMNDRAFYPGFEIFVLREPRALMVGGIEVSAASRAGIHWGDLLLQLNGAALDGKTNGEIEALFSTTVPAKIQLTIERRGAKKTVTFRLERVSAVLKENQQKLVRNHAVPADISDQDLPCVTK